jgi:peptide/nickel transport system permease protein
MSKPDTQGGDDTIGIAHQAASVGTVEDVAVATEPEAITDAGKVIVGRTPGQLAWARLKRDKTAVWSMVILAFFVLIALAAPLISWAYGDDATTSHGDQMDLTGYPLGYFGGVSAEHWLGIRPSVGKDVLMQLVYGVRTSLTFALVAAMISTAIGLIVGIIAGYSRGWADRILSWITDVTLAFPFFLFALAIVPTITNRLDTPQGIPVWKKLAVLMTVFVFFGWTYTARIIRGQVISIREREYVEAARAAGAGLWHILFKQILPNLWAPIIVTFSLGVPTIITAEAALAIFGIGIKPADGVADLGEFVNGSVAWMTHPDIAGTTVYLPGLTLFVIVLAFNLLGDSLRDALDPKSLR